MDFKRRRLESHWRTFTGLKRKFCKKLIFEFQPAVDGSAIYIGRSVYYFEPWYDAIYRLDLSATEELEKVEQIGEQPDHFDYPVLFQADSDYCV